MPADRLRNLVPFSDVASSDKHNRIVDFIGNSFIRFFGELERIEEYELAYVSVSLSYHISSTKKDIRRRIPVTNQIDLVYNS